MILPLPLLAATPRANIDDGTRAQNAATAAAAGCPEPHPEWTRTKLTSIKLGTASMQAGRNQEEARIFA